MAEARAALKLAVSNLAWSGASAEVAAEVLVAEGVSGIEVAPGKLFAEPLSVSADQIAACRRWWESRGLPIVAAQSLLYGQPGLTLFDSPASRRATLAYLTRMIGLCANLGAQVLVFGSPRNRSIGQRSPAEVQDLAVAFFSELAEVARREGTRIGLEAIPPENGADYILNTHEALALVRAVNHPHFRLHLDTASLALAGEDIATAIRDAGPELCHVHISEPQLSCPGATGRVDHATIASELHRHRYGLWISIEMREVQPFCPTDLAKAVRFVREMYLR